MLNALNVGFNENQPYPHGINRKAKEQDVEDSLDELFDDWPMLEIVLKNDPQLNALAKMLVLECQIIKVMFFFTLFFCN